MELQGARLRLDVSSKPLSKNMTNTCDPPLNRQFTQLFDGVCGTYFFTFLESVFLGVGNMTNMVLGAVG